MRLSFDLPVAGGQVAVVTRSRRNLLALLAQLDAPGSTRVIVSENCPAGWALAPRAESHELHFAQRSFAPGPMRPRPNGAWTSWTATSAADRAPERGYPS